MKHNFAHWLLTVVLRIFYFLFWLPVSIYLFALGCLLANKGIHQFVPASIYPYFIMATRLTFFKLGPWYDQAFIWWTIVVGIPLMIAGVSLFLINIFNLYYTIFIADYNHTHCPICKT